MKENLFWIWDLLFHPWHYFSKHKHVGWKRPICIFVTIELLLAIINYSPYYLLPNMSGNSPEIPSLFAVALNCAILMIGIIILGLIFHMFIRLVNGKKNLSQTYQVLMSSLIPLLISHISSVLLLSFLVRNFQLMDLVKFTNFGIHLLIAVWVLIIIITGIQIVHNISLPHAVISATIPFMIITILQYADSGYLLGFGLHPLDFYLNLKGGNPGETFLYAIITKTVHLL